MDVSRLLSQSGTATAGSGRGGGGGSRTSVQSQFSQPGAGIPADKFLRSFCRYCHSNPFYCGEMLQLCYAEARTV